MNKYQRTIKTDIELTGTGLHTGVPSTIRFLPAPVNTGVVFRIPANGQTIDLKADILRGQENGLVLIE